MIVTLRELGSALHRPCTAKAGVMKMGCCTFNGFLTVQVWKTPVQPPAFMKMMTIKLYHAFDRSSQAGEQNNPDAGLRRV